MTTTTLDDYDTNEHGEVFNGEGTYDATADALRSDVPVMLNWIDQRGTLLQVLFVRPLCVGGPGGGPVSGPDDKLIVSVMGHSAYAFSSEVHPSYCAEKLGVSGEVTNERLAKLISEVLARL